VFTTTAYGNANWLLTLRPRIGFVAPNNWLFYASGGLAVTRLQAGFQFSDTLLNDEAGKVDKLVAGYAVGGGIEAPLTDRLSIKADYLHVQFANTAGIETGTEQFAVLPPVQPFTHSTDLKADIFRAGLNYHLGGPDPASSGNAFPPSGTMVMPIFPGWAFEAGARQWFSTGHEQEGPLFADGSPLTLLSRLTYGGLDGVSGEIFARADHVSGIFIKGNLGAGALTSGHLNDEDFPAFNVYSNTLASSSGHIGYATIDAGYNFLTVPGAKVGAFVGYNYYTQGINNYGCAQIAGDLAECGTPSIPILGLTLYDHFHSLRVGLSTQVMLTDRLRLTADAAYLPWVFYQGLDDHLERQLLGPQSALGDGAMLESILDYYVTPAWTVGVGGRLWAWNFRNGSTGFDFLGTPADNGVEPEGHNAERYGVFVQSSYRWGDPQVAVHQAATHDGLVMSAEASGPMDWTGFYVGGHLGGGWSHAQWSDPFSSTVGPGGFINVAGLGDSTNATGPLGGVQVGANWQTGPWVLGVQTDASAANITGQNTCFSGLGGINCQHTVTALGTLIGRAGYAWDRSLAYVKGGAAWTDTVYNLIGDTSALTLGSEGTALVRWGWTAGIGVEYAVTDHWTTFAEYDHIGMPSTNVAFPNVATINTATIDVKQSVDIFKVGVNYKFGTSAADMPVAPRMVDKRPPPAVAPAANWTGFYIGGNYGALFEMARGTSNFTDTADVDNPQANAFAKSALLGGVQGGYNWQWDQRWLVGLEGDWDWSNASYSFCRHTDVSGFDCFDAGNGFETIGSSLEWLATARVRVGAVWNNWLIYATGGPALGRVDTDLTLSCATSGCGAVSSTPVLASSTTGDTKIGWAAGLGAETMLWSNWSARVEWLYADLGTISAALPTAGTTGIQTAVWSRTERFNAVRLGLNYHY
jgi:opacity protein-like surface antigen